jgi:hypothetical protein
MKRTGYFYFKSRKRTSEAFRKNKMDEWYLLIWGKSGMMEYDGWIKGSENWTLTQVKQHASQH